MLLVSGNIVLYAAIQRWLTDIQKQPDKWQVRLLQADPVRRTPASVRVKGSIDHNIKL